MKPVLISTCVILSLLNSAFGLKCWLCLGSLDSDCFRGEEQAMVVQECGAAVRNATTPKSPLGLKNIPEEFGPDIIVTTCVSFVIEQYGSKLIERGCGYIYEGVDICEYMSEIADIWSCDSCNEDKCNSRPKGQTINVQLVQ